MILVLESPSLAAKVSVFPERENIYSYEYYILIIGASHETLVAIQPDLFYKRGFPEKSAYKCCRYLLRVYFPRARRSRLASTSSNAYATVQTSPFTSDPVQLAPHGGIWSRGRWPRDPWQKCSRIRRRCSAASCRSPRGSQQSRQGTSICLCLSR